MTGSNSRSEPSLPGTRLAPACGVELTGIDLSQPLSPVDLGTIRAAFLAHHVVVLPGQSLSREQQFAFAVHFGEVEAHGGHRGETKRQDVAHVLSNLDAAGRPVIRHSPAANYHWHTDKPYQPVPPLLTMLHAVQLPPRGGDTEFANMIAAYDALSDSVKRSIAGLRIAFGPAFQPERGITAEHPLVRTHPDTGAKSLYLGNHSRHIAGLPPEASAALLEELLAHATQRRFVYTHRWRLGDLVMWDNRCLLHRVVLDDALGQHARILYRSIVKGSVPC